MADNKQVHLVSTNIVLNGTAEILRQTTLIDDGVTYGPSNHRHSLAPGQDFHPFIDESLAAGVEQAEIDRTCRICVAAWDETTVAIYQGVALEDYNAALAEVTEQFNISLAEKQAINQELASAVLSLKAQLQAASELITQLSTPSTSE